MMEAYISAKDMAEHLGVTRETLINWTKDGVVPGYKVGRVWRFKLDEVENRMEELRYGKT